MDLQQLTDIGVSLGLDGEELRKFIDDERALQRQDRVEQRELIKAQQELVDKQLQLQRQGSDKGSSEIKCEMKMPKLPSFQETDDMDSYLLRFERYAGVQGLKKEVWATTLSALLTGKAMETYCRLTEEDAVEYNKVKEALLKRYNLTAEGYGRGYVQQNQR